MKKYFVTLVIVIICSVSYSQNFKAGMSFGMTNTDVLGTDPNDGDQDFGKLGITIGLFAQLPIGDKSSLGFEMNYIQKGCNNPFLIDSIGNPYGTSFKLRLNYIEVPILYSHKFSFNIGKILMDRFSYEVGPAFGFLIYSDVNLNQSGYEPIYYGAYKTIDISAIGGISYQLGDNWKLHFRYENSILPIHPHPSGATGWNPFYLYPNVGEVNMVFSYSISYTF